MHATAGGDSMEMRVHTMVRECVGRDLVDAAGDKIGTIDGVYVDDATAQPEWFAVRTGWFGTHVSFVPVHGTDVTGADIQSLYSKDTVRDSPHVEPRGHLTPDEQRALFDYYDVNDVAPISDPAAMPADLTSPPPTPSDHLHNDAGDVPLTEEWTGLDQRGGS
jgi:hypothetical protein